MNKRSFLQLLCGATIAPLGSFLRPKAPRRIEPPQAFGHQRVSQIQLGELRDGEYVEVTMRQGEMEVTEYWSNRGLFFRLEQTPGLEMSETWTRKMTTYA